jgi:hypothetical protein
MNRMSKGTTTSATRISFYVLLIIFITLALSMTALILAFNAFSEDPVISGWLILLGFVGVGISMYVLLQTRRRIRHLSITVAPVTTTIECKKCGFKSVREFQRGDHVFKELEPCQKCNEKMMITSIYREVKEGEKEHYRY